MRIDDLAGKGEIAGIDLRRDFGIGGVDVLRRDREPIGRFGSDQSDAIEGPAQKSEKTQSAAAGKPADEPKLILPARAAQVIPPSMATPTSDSTNDRAFVTDKFCDEETVEARKPRLRYEQDERAGCGSRHWH